MAKLPARIMLVQLVTFENMTPSDRADFPPVAIKRRQMTRRKRGDPK